MPDSIICPHCGSDRSAGQSADRVCDQCGNTFPAIAVDQRRGRAAALWLTFTLFCVVVAFGSVLLLVEGGDRSTAAAVGTVLLLVSVAAAVFGVYSCLRTMMAAPVVFDAGPPGRPLPSDRARAIVRAVAEAHQAWHLVRQLDGIKPKRIANARARFAPTMTDDEVPLILADMSFLRNGKAGFLLTNRAIYSDRLRRPITLDEVRSVDHRRPDVPLSLLEGGFFLVHLVFPPAALLFIALGMSRASRRKNALVVNGKVVFAGDKNLAWDFWVGVLPALAAELCRPRIVLLEVFPADGEPVRMSDPDWPAVEQVVRSLNANTLPVLRLWTAGWTTGLEVAGGAGRYALRPLRGGPGDFDPAANAPALEVDAGQVIPASSVDRVVRIARRFMDTGSVQ